MLFLAIITFVAFIATVAYDTRSRNDDQQDLGGQEAPSRELHPQGVEPVNDDNGPGGRQRSGADGTRR